jgi:fluoride ion exporter CrcB/FEX
MICSAMMCADDELPESPTVVDTTIGDFTKEKVEGYAFASTTSSRSFPEIVLSPTSTTKDTIGIGDEKEGDDDSYSSSSHRSDLERQQQQGGGEEIIVHTIPSFKRRRSPNSKGRNSVMSSSGSLCCSKDNQNPPLQQQQINSVFYISASAIIASSARVYLSRLFGEDCEDQSMTDFLTPLSDQICVTAGGRTAQTGGALCRDLPANVLGSFILGLITPSRLSSSSPPRLPWFRKDHPLQRDDVFHTGLGVGLCGCLTTFASWNTQMVLMMVRKSVIV